MAISVSAEMEKKYRYAYASNAVPFLKRVRLHARSGSVHGDLKVEISSEPMFFKTWTCEEPAMTESDLSIEKPMLEYDASLAASITEESKAEVVICVYEKEKLLTEKRYEVMVEPLDESSLYQRDRTVQAAFVTPHDPLVEKLARRTWQIRKERNLNPSVAAYHFSTEDAEATISAAYQAVCEEQIPYIWLNPNYNPGYQRLQTAGNILRNKCANCIEMTILIAALLERLSLRPAIVHIKEHAFLGCWLQEKSLEQPVSEDIEYFRKITKPDMKEFLVLESTLACAGNQADFEQACRRGQEELEKKQAMFYVLDIHRARLAGVKPIPSVMNCELPPDLQQVVLPEKPVNYAEAVPEQIEKYQMPERYDRWMAEILDSSARSSLVSISMRGDSAKAAPILVPKKEGSRFYEKICQGGVYELSERPEDFEGSRSAELYEMYNGAEALGNVTRNGLEQNRLYLNTTKDGLKKKASALEKQTQEAMRQRGIHLLYMAFGTLCWREDGKKTAHYAPILLIPAELEKEGRTVTVQYTGGEVLFNDAVLQILRHRFDIRRPDGLSPVPKLADGRPNLPQILHCLRTAVKKEKNLQVFDDHAFLGLFDFSSYAQWNDLRSGAEAYMQHPVISAILRGVWEEPGTASAGREKKWTEEDLLLPYELDSSQIQAVIGALQEESFVLIGPPGTGKTMTLISILLNLIADGKTALFAAEKAAALQVAYERLKQNGLEQFFLYLPTGQMKPSALLEQLKKVLDDAQEAVQESGYDAFEQKHQALKEQIGRQLSLLHGVRICGMSLYQLIAQYIPLADCRPAFELTEEFTAALSEENIHQMQEQLEQLTEAGRAIGHPSGHCLTNWPEYTYRVNLSAQLHEELETYVQALNTVAVLAARLAEQTGKEWDGTAASARSMLPVRSGTREKLIALIPAEFVKFRHLIEVIQAAAAGKNYEEKKAQLCAKYGKLVNGNTEELKKLQQKWTLSRGIQRAAFRREIMSLLPGKVLDDNEITKMFLELRRFAECPVPQPVAAETELSAMELLELAKALKGTFGTSEELRNSMRDLEVSGKFLQEQNELKEAWQTMTDAAEKVQELIPGLLLWMDGSGTAEEMIAEVQRWISGGLGQLREWSTYVAVRKQCMSIGLAPFVELYEQGMAHETLGNAFRSAVCFALIRRTYRCNADVQAFTGFSFLRLVERYQEVCAAAGAVAAEEIRSRRRKEVRRVLEADPEIRRQAVLFRRLYESGGKKTSIRQILNEYIPDLARLLTPCMIMPPTAAAEYFEPDFTFDVTLFDEASQLTTARSIGAIGHSKGQVIVTGDPMQLPPTSFFTTEEEYEELSAVAQEQESILSECLTLGMKVIQLKNHYRSVSESLITFCNAKYYGGALTTFPSADSRTSQVTLHRTDGVYDRGGTRTNEKEAEAIVRFLEERFCAGEKRSYGIIAFHVNQQERILRLISQRAAQNEAFAQALARMRAEGKELFCRNLENVQGDEADVILFSCAYGKDKTGTFSMNFGPLNRDNAHRRLNVAFSRSREEMHIFCSFDPDELRLTEKSSRALRDLRDFLRYAQGSLSEKDLMAEVHTESKTELGKQDGFRQQICSYLESCGYSFDCQAGSSDCQVDIAVIDPNNKDRYSLGILLNNEAYYQNRSCYDREIGRNHQLKLRGWKLLRLFSADYWDYPLREQKRILEALAG